MKLRSNLLALTVGALLAAGPAPAATKTWTGSSSGNWNLSANWSPPGAPVSGDHLIFDSTAVEQSITNNLVNRTFASLTFESSAYVVQGNPFTVSGHFYFNHAGGTTYIFPDITWGTDVSLVSISSSAVIRIYGDVNLNGHNLQAFGPATVFLGGAVSGTGNLHVTGGETRLIGGDANTFSGTTHVSSGGTLQLQKFNNLLENSSGPGNFGITSVPGNLDITGAGSEVILIEDNQIADTATVTIHQSALLNLRARTDKIAELIFDGGGQVDTLTGRLELGGDVIVRGTGTRAEINGTLHLGTFNRTFTVGNIATGVDLTINAEITGGIRTLPGGGFVYAGLVKSGPGELMLSSPNSYRGTTTINDGYLGLDYLGTLGDTLGDTTVNSNGVLFLTSQIVTGESLTLNSIHPDGAFQTWLASTWDGPITITTNTTIAVVVSPSSLKLNGPIAGSGTLTLKGDTIELGGDDPNTFTGDMVTHCRILRLNHNSALPGNYAVRGGLTLGYGPAQTVSNVVEVLQSDQLRATTQVNFTSKGVLNMKNHNVTVGRLFFEGGRISAGLGTLTLNGNVRVDSGGAEISGDPLGGALHLGAATRTFDGDTGTLEVRLPITGTGGVRKAGDFVLTLFERNTYSGVTTVDAGTLLVRHNEGLGAITGGTVVNDGLLKLVTLTVGNEPLTLNGLNPLAAVNACFWSGPVTVNNDATLSASLLLNFRGAIAGPGGLTLTGKTFEFSGDQPNTYAGDTRVHCDFLRLNHNDLVPGNHAIAGDLFIGDGTGSTATARLLDNAQIADSSSITLAQSAVLGLGGYNDAVGPVIGQGQIQLGNGQLTCQFDATSAAFDGVILGSGGITKSGTGTWSLNGNNTYQGDTMVLGGTLLVNGQQPASGLTIGTGAVLGGRGSAGTLDVTGGSVAPGESPSILSSGTAVFEDTATFAVELNGQQAGAGYDQLNVTGAVGLQNPSLEVSLGFLPLVGDSFNIINNDGTDPVAGNFGGLLNNATLPSGPATLRINYDGGTGNDVVLTVTAITNVPPLVMTSYTSTGTNLTLRWEGGLPGYGVEKATELTTNTTWQVVTPPGVDSESTLPLNTPAGFYRVREGQ